ncbi:hypothetical protein IAE35_10760 [Pseudomonas sp. S75]|uniref:hypothetical protein n=1 Tax=unclassified Pseudomonas TaxID=196821 RepID=UPI0019077C4D|nr:MULTISPECIES: hypothetical protein [unclassified Pseudomonas]MBJ9976907.1 hypothetical protein [Pseudomonas sp. S30]MBK0153818.1 hypothetical protein [Pseudomonas sp. S75]
MAKHYFVRKFTLTLSGERQFHLLSLSSGNTFRAKLDPSLKLKPLFPGMTYSASIVKRGRGLVIASVASVASVTSGTEVGLDECKALAGFVSTQGALPLYAAPYGLGSLLIETALAEGRGVRQLLDHESRFILGKHLGDAQTAQLQFAWEDYMAFQESVLGIMRQGLPQTAAERMVKHLPVDTDSLLANPLMALPFLEADDASAFMAGFELNPGLRHAWWLLRYLETQSLAGNTVVEVASIYSVGDGDGCAGDGLLGADRPFGDTGPLGADRPFGDTGPLGATLGLDEVFEAVRECERHGWVVEMEGLIQLRSNYCLQNAVRDHLTRICGPFHPVYSQREIEHAFSRLSAFTPDLFAHDMYEEVSWALNSRVVIVRYDDTRAAIEFTQQYRAVYELLTNTVPSSVTVAKSRCAAYEDELGVAHVPFYEITDGIHGQAIVVQQFNQLPLFEIFQLLAGLGNVVSLVLLVDATLPANAAVEQMSRYFRTIDVHLRQQGALPIQQCLWEVSDIEARIDAEDVQRIAVVCDCPEISLLLNRRYSSVPAETKVPKKGDLIRLSPRGLRRLDDALIRVVNVKPGELFVLQSQRYRTIKAEEFAEYAWAGGFVLSPNEAFGVALPPVLVFTSAQRGSDVGSSGGEMKGMALVRNLQAQGVRVIEHCAYEIEGYPRVAGAGTLQRIVPLVE